MWDEHDPKGREPRNEFNMALFKSDVGEVSGKIGGKVYARNRGGTYIRGWAKPTNPNSSSQQRARSDFGDAVAAWSGLTVLQRAAWETYAANVAMTNRLGETVYLTGQQHFVRSYAAMSVAGLTPVSDGPTTFSLPNPGDITVTGTEGVEGSGLVVVVFDDTKAWCDEDGAALLVLQSREQAPTINYFKGPYRLCDSIAGDGVTPPTSPTNLDTVFDLTETNKVFIHVRLIRADGRVSEPVLVGGLVGAV